jgi:phosphatidylserine/phosphatidylglycerophosphate/cardiolipin synthase-like enzyme
MKTTFKTILCLVLVASSSTAYADTLIPAGVPHGPATGHVAACFRPNDDNGCVQFIVAAIDSAKSDIRVQAYDFTSMPILSALVKAKLRGIDVEIILDKINDPLHAVRANAEADSGSHRKSRYAGGSFVFNAGIPTFIDREPRIAHNKIIIIDSELVIGGSYNYSASAEKNNAENITFIDSKVVASWFLNNWNNRKELSDPFVSASK